MQRIEKLIKSGQDIALEISHEQAQKLIAYMDALLIKNEAINLTRITDQDEFILLHLLDSLTLLPFIKNDPRHILDLGTGGGFPGIPLAIMLPGCQFMLLDSTRKKLNVVEEIAQSLELKNVQVMHGRAEELGHDQAYRQHFDLVVSRAVANLNSLSEYALPFVKVGGYFLSMKGKEYESELESGKKAIKKLGGQIIAIEKANLPQSDYQHVIIVVEKVRSTPEKLPRISGKIKKEPLK
ncbi:16S rRNA (guanine(527)-N(7))-methyltransferase RsmG [Eubacteriaceae bacterium ES2]|nr:16S rRNA (guanine(527)-N(7))-methyltransferase RsmG [Eubacteriaceae bacterium ES2]